MGLQAKSRQNRGKFARSIVKVLPIRTLAGALSKQKGRWIEVVPNVLVVQSLSEGRQMKDKNKVIRN